MSKSIKEYKQEFITEISKIVIEKNEELSYVSGCADSFYSITVSLDLSVKCEDYAMEAYLGKQLDILSKEEYDELENKTRMTGSIIISLEDLSIADLFNLLIPTLK